MASRFKDFLERWKKPIDFIKKIWANGWVKFGVFLAGLAIVIIIVLSVKGFDEYGILFFLRTVLVDNFLRINSIVLGVLVFIGYMVLGRGLQQSIIGAIKTMIGVLLLGIGSTALVNLASPVFKALQFVGGSASITPLDPYLGWSSSNNFLNHGLGGAFVSWVTFALIVGLVVNIILIMLKRWTNVHSLMVTGHVMFQQTSILVAALYVTAFRDIDGGTSPNIGTQVGVIIFGGIIMGTYWGVASNATIRGANVVTHDANFAVGHQQMFGAALAYRIGKYFGKASDSAETKVISKKLKVFEDNIFTQTMIIMILFVILIVIIQTSTSQYFEPGIASTGFGSWNVAGGSFWAINMLIGSLQIIAAILALTAGVRMFVTELQQSFQGIALRILPDAVVAVDCAATYGFSPNSVTYGFLSGIIAQFIAVGVVIGISVGTKGGLPIVIPLFITLFFNSGTIGVFANASGGWRASLIVPAIFGFIEIFTAAGAVAMLSQAFDKGVAEGVLNTTYVNENNATVSASIVGTGFIGMADWNFFFAIPFMIAGSSTTAAFVIFAALVIVMLIMAQFTDSSMREKPNFVQKRFNLHFTPKKVFGEAAKGATANA